MRKNVDKNEIRRLESFKQQETKLRLKGNTKNTIYISKEGLFNLILESKSKGAKKFKKWISKILDKIDDGEDIYEQDDIKNDFDIIKCKDYQDWALTHNTSQYKDENIFYLGCIGIIKNIRKDIDTNIDNNSLVFKFGISADEFQRITQHTNNIENYTCFYVIKCDRYNKLEKDFKLELKRKNLLRHIKINKIMYTELFVLDDKYFTMDDVYKFIESWIDKDNKTRESNSDAVLLAVEATKQKEIELKMKEIDAKIKEDELKMKEIELKILQIKSKQS